MPNVSVRAIGHRALGRIEQVEDTTRKSGLENSLNVLSTEEDSDLRTAAMEAAFRIWEKVDPKEGYLQKEILSQIAKHGDTDRELIVLSGLVFFHGNGLIDASISQILDRLRDSQIEPAHVLSNLDKAIRVGDQRWKFDKVASVFAALFQQIQNSPEPQNYYGFSQLARSNSRNMAYLFSNWLFDGSSTLCAFLTGILSDRDKGTLVKLPKDLLPSEVFQQIFLMRKCVGYLWHHEVTAASFLLSFVKNGKPEARDAAETLLFNPMLLCYGGDLRTFLETQITNKSKRVTDCVQRLLKKHDHYISGLEKTGELVELRPTLEQRRYAALKDMERNKDIQKQAQEKSVFANLVTRQTLLYGKKSFSLVHGAKGATSPHISSLSEISYSMELPRLMVVDPVGFNEMLTIFRAERLK